MFAAEKGHVGAVSALLEAGADVDAKDKNFKTALMYAEKNGKKGVVAALLEAGADVNAEDKNVKTALMLAAEKGQMDVVKFLEEADIYIKGGLDRIALVFAAQQGNVGAVSALLEAGADIDAKDKNGMTALMYAAQQGNVGAVSALLEAGADVDARNKAGMTALMYAAQRGNVGAVSALLEAGADMDAQDKWGHTALMYAEKKGKKGVVFALIKGSLDASYAAGEGPHEEIVSLLEKNIATYQYITPCQSLFPHVFILAREESVIERLQTALLSSDHLEGDQIINIAKQMRTNLLIPEGKKYTDYVTALVDGLKNQDAAKAALAGGEENPVKGKWTGFVTSGGSEKGKGSISNPTPYRQ